MKKQSTPSDIANRDMKAKRERQLEQSLEVINELLSSGERTHVVDSIREVLRSRRDKTSPSI